MIDPPPPALGALRAAAWVFAVCLIEACAGPRRAFDPDHGAEAFRGKSIVLLPLDTAAVRADRPEDVVDGFGDDGGSLSGARILSSRFQDRFLRSLDQLFARGGAHLVTAEAFAQAATPPLAIPHGDTAAAAPGEPAPPPIAVDPEFTLRVEGLEARRRKTTQLVPKIGTLTQYPLELTGAWVLMDQLRGKPVVRDTFTVLVTAGRVPEEMQWRKAFDEAARKVAHETPLAR